METTTPLRIPGVDEALFAIIDSVVFARVKSFERGNVRSILTPHHQVNGRSALPRVRKKTQARASG
jgi:hypothetical protein